ncbi:MAG: bifunctional glutamate N-acetyltransferase/amino-acid acetyltransferase ArgJ [Helicobacteraceae bacterium]|jgi:glutamate N-acetyltransferase/amino-acid N-acetyltransferase|nr:bifunctional glutamate N-acetyltransferase/amino-acid acetyltransferase ArgJ [Helicobacteraceae bacterium]
MEILSIGGGVCAPKGFFADGLNCGLKVNGAADLAFMRSSAPCNLAAVFTSNRFACAHIRHAKAHKGKVNGVIVNSKNANAMNGSEGITAVEKVVAAVPFENFLMASTGVIGAPLPVETIIGGIRRFDWNAACGDAAAKAIMTTDRWEKQIAFEVRCDGGTFTIGAMAKGAGMIAPQLATMLCFITTDAAANQEAFQAHLNGALDESFNAISVDGDMSTNDTIYLLANGASGVYEAEAFDAALRRALHFLALEIVRDGEGATKLVAFEVKNAAAKEEAKKAARMLSTSLLVKTALFGADPNWGRIASTIGAAQIECDAESLTISIGGVTVYEQGINRMDREREEAAAAALRAESFRVVCDLAVGAHSYTSYGCDLGHEYVRINADYRT